MAHRAAARFVGGCAFILAASLSGCATPQYSDVSIPEANFTFQVPRSWGQISGPSLASQLKARGWDTHGAWVVAYDAGPEPRAADYWNSNATRPFVFVEYGKLSSSQSRAVSYGMLRDFYLPVTSTARQNAVAQGFPFTGFREIRDQLLSIGQGTQGVRETYEYTLAGHVDTFDEDVATNADHTAILLLVVHCTAACYSSYRARIDYIMSSVSPG
jgi:hypothetical protein